MRDDVWPARRVATGDGVELHVRDTGPGSGSPTLVLLHGLGGYAEEWWPVARELLGSSRTVAFDQRGHGASTTRPDDLSREAYVADVGAVIDGLGLGRVVLVGQSMGAHTALMASAALPHLVDGAILVEGGVGGGGQDPTDAVMAWFESWPVPFVDATAAAEHLGGGPVGRAWAAGLGVTPEGLVPRFDPDVLRSAIEAVHATERWAEWRDITGSLLLVRAQNGYLAGEEARRMLEENARARLVEVADAGHDVHLDSAEAVAAAIRTFARNDVS